MRVESANVVVVGSLNLDYIASVAALPRAGETVPASDLVRRFGGKGANQAVAAARQGARVSMIGCVGADDDGRAYLRRLRDERIDFGGVSISARALTGTALIAVDRQAENLIVVCSGANGCLTPATIRAQAARIAAARIVLLQLEIPLPAVIETVRLANRAGVPVVLNPSPLRAGFPWGQCRLNTLVTNAVEAQAIFGLSPARIAKDWRACRRLLARRSVDQLIITRGAKPTMCVTARGYWETAALPVKPVDTVGAGDAFAGALVARLAQGTELAEALRIANCAGALATLRRGAQEAIPSRSATERAASRWMKLNRASLQGERIR